MTILKATTWQDKSGGVINAPIKFTQVIVPYSAASGGSATYYAPESAYTTGNTYRLYTFNYTPASASSYIMFSGFFDVDRSGTVGQERLCMFVNGTCISLSYMQPRNQGHELQQHPLAGTYTNSSTSTVTFDLRCNDGWTMYTGGPDSNDMATQSTLHIYEYQR